MSTEQEQAEKLKEARSRMPKNPKEAIKKIANAASLMVYFNPFMDWLFGIALALALLKDILDITLIGSIPVLGTAITLMISLTIALIMIITGSAQKVKISKFAKRYVVLIGGTLIEMVFGIDFMPVETAVIIIIFYMTLKQRKEAVEKANQPAPTAEPQQNYA